jgi:GTP-binding protein HflX
VRQVLSDIGAEHVPELLVLNKIDVAPADRVADLRRVHPEAVAVSALTGEGIGELMIAVTARLRDVVDQRAPGPSRR